MRPLRYSINVTSDGCCDHRVMIADEDLHRHAAENLAQADPLLLAWEPAKLWSRVAAGGADGSGARLDANDRLSPPQAMGQSPVVLTIYDERQAGKGGSVLRGSPTRYVDAQCGDREGPPARGSVGRREERSDRVLQGTRITVTKRLEKMR